MTAPLPPPRYFEDVSVGDELPPWSTPVLSTAHLVRWSAAIENWHRIHYDRPFATEHDGLPGVVVPGSLKQQWLVRLVTDWAGPHGWVAEVSFQFRGTDVPGTALTAVGRVVRTFSHHGYGIVECEIGLINADGHDTAPGLAQMVLPLRNGPQVPYPFPADLLPPS